MVTAGSQESKLLWKSRNDHAAIGVQFNPSEQPSKTNMSQKVLIIALTVCLLLPCACRSAAGRNLPAAIAQPLQATRNMLGIREQALQTLLRTLRNLQTVARSGQNAQLSATEREHLIEQYTSQAFEMQGVLLSAFSDDPVHALLDRTDPIWKANWRIPGSIAIEIELRGVDGNSPFGLRRVSSGTGVIQQVSFAPNPSTPASAYQANVLLESAIEWTIEEQARGRAYLARTAYFSEVELAILNSEPLQPIEQKLGARIESLILTDPFARAEAEQLRQELARVRELEL